jgi:hypothetical protein
MATQQQPLADRRSLTAVCPLLLLLLQNLSEEVDVQMLFDFFSQFGDIYQCKVDSDLYDQYFGQVRGVHQQRLGPRRS